MSAFDDALEDDDLEDERMLWDELEDQYGRPLTLVELRHELDLLYGLPITDTEFEEELHSQAGWKALKAEIAQREAEIAQREAEIAQREAENTLREENVAEYLYGEILSPPVNDDGTMGDAEGLAWIERVNEIIRTRLDFFSLCKLMNIGTENHIKRKALRMALKRHSENHAMKKDVFVWLDTNMPNFKSMDAAAEAIKKQQPIAFRTARDWVGEWKKLRSASTP